MFNECDLRCNTAKTAEKKLRILQNFVEDAVPP
jgi:hypothetical protein